MNWREYKKVELHRHLEGSMRLQTLLEAAQQTKTKLPTENVLALREQALILKPMADLATVLQRLYLFQAVLATPEIIQRLAYEACIDAYGEGIRVLELRYSLGFIKLNHPDLTYDLIHQAILAGTNQAEIELKGKFAVGLIATISRDQGMPAAEETVDFVLKNKATFIGFDLAGDEAGFHSRLFIKEFERMRGQGLGVTVHSGEIRVPGAAKLVQESIENLGATRIGHGLMIIHDPQVIEFVKAKNAVLELCPTSNVLTSAVDALTDHPIKKLMELGVRVTLNSDDPQFFGISLSHEYEYLVRYLNFSVHDFAKLNEEALAATFIDQAKARRAFEA